MTHVLGRGGSNGGQEAEAADASGDHDVVIVARQKVEGEQRR
jgi:hypothetical protein